MRFLLALACAAALLAQDRPVPPPGVAPSPADRAELESGLQRLKAAIERLGGSELAPDVRIFERAVHYALAYNEFFKPEEVGRAKELLREGGARATALLRGEAPWHRARGLIVRGYVSKIDGSVQPYGLVVPPSYDPALPRRWRLDLWFHGRNETLSELNFLYDRMRNPGEFTPPDTLVLHLYGRYCNANKFAGEVDLFEALESVKRHYAIDENRIVARGFSMGGAAAWHIGAHHAGLWAAVAPGAGFSETPEFLKIRTQESLDLPEWERKLWRMYNATDHAANFANTLLVAYNGDQDMQKQAADIMERALGEEGMRLRRVTGPQTGHRYHPDSKVEIDRMIDAAAARGRDPYPRRVRFTTYTLRYNRMKWVVADALEQHWERARIDAAIAGDGVAVTTANAAAFTLDFGPAGCPLPLDRKPVVTIDGQKLTVAAPTSDGSWTVHFRKTAGKWAEAVSARPEGLAKRHGLQGPVDDAFLDSFLMVRPTAAEPSAWTKAEMDRAIREWRRHFRGEARVRDDSKVNDADIAAHNLILWGDPQSNRLLARIAAQLPVRWEGGKLVMRGQTYDAATHAPILIFPNPLNPDRYVVLNSGFTFREYDYLNNARQVSKLPDWALVDTTVPPNGRYPGKVVAAGFFDERWK